MRLGTLILLLALASPAPGAPSDAPAVRDLRNIQGTWVLVAEQWNGKKSSRADLQKDGKYYIHFVIARDKITRKESGKVRDQSSFVLGPGQNPKTIDLVALPRRPKAGSVPGIYFLEGDTLKICLASEGKPRPVRFRAKAGSEHKLFVLKRKKL